MPLNNKETNKQNTEHPAALPSHTVDMVRPAPVAT